MRTRRKEALACVVSVAVLLGALALLTRLLTPKQHDMGSTWGQFLQEERDSVDALFFGSSLVYCDVVPAVLWEETGLTGYVVAGPEQTIPMTYYYLREALNTQSPQAVFVELTGMFYARYTNYTKTNIGQMPWGINRLLATFREAEPEYRAGLLFPLLFYHDRWSQLTADDFAVTFTGYEADPLAGYTYLDLYRESGGMYDRELARDEANEARSWVALTDIYRLLVDEGIRPVFYVAPGLGRIPAAAMEPLKTRIRTEMPEALVLDCNEHWEEIGADESRDFYDALHYNAAGAEKFSRFLGRWMEENLPLTPLPGQDAELWQSRADHFHQLAAQPLTPAAS